MVGVKNSRVIFKRLRDVFEFVTETFVSAFCEHVSVEESACKETDDHISALLSDLSSGTGLFISVYPEGAARCSYLPSTQTHLFFYFSYILLQFFLKSVFILLLHGPLAVLPRHCNRLRLCQM